MTSRTENDINLIMDNKSINMFLPDDCKTIDSFCKRYTLVRKSDLKKIMALAKKKGFAEELKALGVFVSEIEKVEQ